MNCINFKENTRSEAFSKHNLVPFVATYPVCACAWEIDRRHVSAFMRLCFSINGGGYFSNLCIYWIVADMV